MVGTSDWSLIFFTVLVQLGVGLSLFAGCLPNAVNNCNAIPKQSKFDSIISNKRQLWFIISAITGVGILASLFHLGRPFGAYLTLSNLGISWLSMEIFIVSIFGLFSACTWLCTKRRNILALITSVIGITVIIVQGYTYAESALPAIDNAFPLVFFMLSTLVMGAAVFSRYSILSGSLSALLAVVLTVPCVWTSGSPIMKLTSQMWSMSISYWFGTALLLIALFIAKKKKNPLLLSVIIILAVFSLRITFFAETPHVWLLLGMPN